MRSSRIFTAIQVLLAVLMANSALAQARAKYPDSSTKFALIVGPHLTHYRLGTKALPDDGSGPGYELVEPGQPALLQFAILYNSDCTDAGPPTAALSSNPAHGTVSFQNGTYTSPPGYNCAGYSYKTVEVYYTWTDTTSGATQDVFGVNFYDPSGNLRGSQTYSPVIEAIKPDKQVGSPNTPGTCKCGDPISIGIGNVYESVTDYQTAGQSPLGFSRSYNSLGNPATLAVSLGSNWRSNYDRYLQITESSGTPSTVLVERADGQMLQFTPSGSSWVTDSDVDMTLVQSGTTWVLKDQTDTVETYTQTSPTEAMLASIELRGGYKQILAYNTSNQLASVTDTFGRQLTFNYNGSLLQTVITADQQTLTFGYTSFDTGIASGNVLTSVTYPTSPGTSVTYLYQDGALPAALTGVMDEDGNLYSSWTYDNNGRGLTSQQGTTGASLTTITYNDNDGSRLVTNALGEHDLYKFTILQGVPKVTEIDRQASYTFPAATELFTYDANGYLASKTDWNGNLTSITNNSEGLPTKVVKAFGTPVAETTVMEWNANYHVPSLVETTGLRTVYGYNGLGSLVARTDRETGSTRSWSYKWDNGLLKSVSGPRTDVKQITTLTYNAHGSLQSVTDAAGHTTLIPASTIGGRPLKLVDPNGVVTQFDYDGRWRLLATHLKTSVGTLTTQFAYDPAGNLLKKTWPDRSYLAYGYDTAHRLVQVIDPLKDTLTYTLDALGDKTQTQIANPGGTVTWQDYRYFDTLGRLSQDTRGAYQTTYLTYDNNGNAITVVDPNNFTTKKTYDALNRLSVVKDPAGGITHFAYDTHDRVLAVQSAIGALTSYNYDGFGRLMKQISPDTGTTQYAYDPADNLLTSLDGAGITTGHAYDALNRLISTTYPADAPENVSYIYDQPGHGFGVGHLTSLTDAVGSEAFAYDERGNKLTEARGSGSIALTTQYSYDAASRLSGIGYPSGTLVSYAYNLAGQATAMQAQLPGTTAPATIASSITYDPFGR